MELKIEYIAVEDLKPYEKNNKKHEDFDIGEIAKSISKYEMIDPVGIWGKDNTIVEGHGRVLACKQLGIDKVPCIRLDHLTDEQRREYAIVHNKSQELALYDFDNLADELAELDFDGFDFDFEKFEETSFIQDLLEESFADVKSEDKKQEFLLSFTFPYSVKQSFYDYIKQNSKNKLAELMMREVLGNGD
jgi:ParB-like chromosome segregation protein Spo0J